MQITITESNQFGKLTPENLKAFEDSLGTTLPESYRGYLLKHHGGQVDGARRSGDLHHVFGIHHGPSWARLSNPAKFNGVVPDRVLPIADDPGGNLFCLSISGPDRGAVYFWDHERGPDASVSLTQLAPDFDSYFRGLAIKVAIVRKRLKEVQQIAKEIGVNVPVYAGKTLLDLPFERGSLRMVKRLVAAGGKIRPDALIEAVRNDARNTTRYLLERGIYINYAIPETGFTALMLAASCNTTEIAEALLKHGANPGARNRWGKTAADLAHSSRMKQLLSGNVKRQP